MRPPKLPGRRAGTRRSLTQSTIAHSKDKPMFDWMVWTLPVAVFFSCIALMLLGMTVWEMKSPTTTRKGWLPIATTRGDRLFIGLLLAAYINLVFIGLAGKFAQWFSLEQEPSIWISFLFSMAVLALVMKKG
jgi:predicted small integral membrane protein